MISLSMQGLLASPQKHHSELSIIVTIRHKPKDHYKRQVQSLQKTLMSRQRHLTSSVSFLKTDKTFDFKNTFF